MSSVLTQGHTHSAGSEGQLWEKGEVALGSRWGAGTADRPALLARCFSVNFYGMQKEFLFYFVFL